MMLPTMQFRFFSKKSQMTAHAQSTGFEMIRCKQPCLHHPHPTRTAILIIDPSGFVVERLVRCKVCFEATTDSPAKASPQPEPEPAPAIASPQTGQSNE